MTMSAAIVKAVRLVRAIAHAPQLSDRRTHQAGPQDPRPHGPRTPTPLDVDHGPVTPATFRAVHDAYVRQVTAGLVEHINSSQPTPTEMLRRPLIGPEGAP